MATAIVHSFCTNSIPQTQWTNSITRPTHHMDQASTTSTSCSSHYKPRPQLASSKLHNSVLARRLSSCAESGQMAEALALFRSAEKPDTFLWNIIIRGYANHELFDAAVDFYYQMLTAGVRPDHFTFPFVLKSLAALSDRNQGLKTHGALLKLGLDGDLFVCNSLISFYSKLSLVASAERVFDEMPVRDAVSWNSMIEGYVSNGEELESLRCFRTMQQVAQLKPDRFSVMSVLEACCLLVLPSEIGKQIHCHAVRHGLSMDTKVCNSLLDMYCKCGNMAYAERLFDTALHKNLVAWNVMLGGYSLNNQPDCALACLIDMQVDSVDPDTVTLVNFLPACTQLENLSHIKTVHGASTRRGLVPHLALETAVIDSYAKCGELRLAELLFTRMTERSLVSWNAMITAYAQNGKCLKALRLFYNLLHEWPLKPDDFTVSCIIPAYAQLESLRHGKQIHAYAIKLGYITNTSIVNSMINMYARCGDLQASKVLFKEMSCKDITSWNTMLMAYGIHGFGKDALETFSRLKEHGLQPNESTFVSVLSACGISGLADEGWTHFNSMEVEYGIVPQVEHYGCMVDLLGRAGDLGQAKEFIETMPLAPTARIWGALLTASRNRNNTEIAEFAAENIFSLEHDNTGCYVLLSNMYADAGRWEDAERMRVLMKEQGLKQTIGRSMVELNSKTTSFTSGDRSHDESYTIHQVLDFISKQIGECAGDPAIVFKQGNREVASDSSPRRHSVRLAVAFGLISSTIGSPILVKKNVRICASCHNAMKFISRFTGREIVVGDSRIYHHFSGGFCSCGDYW
ncbi:pentatricopeptide repeat-containing protein, chloroplastic [Iris pallida]|uniref:Pentatricopeptide repeat-containing protein, chloroplastic n=1 Tax=Iris pallida TaxID=29817 RepID=A0AAX6GI77_IRIPA|nr:pentatricopeptide repeat-containing protein, chloroplastic [Iris pallida]